MAERDAAVDATAFIHGLRFDALPADVVACAKRCLLDLAGVAAAGSRLPSAKLARDHAATHMASRAREARIRYLDGDFQVTSPGSFVRCAVTGVPIPLEELKYWSVDLQEAYATPEAVLQRHRS